MEKENPTVEKERVDGTPNEKMKIVHSYLDGDFMEVDTGDGMEGDMNRYISEPVHVRDPLQWWKYYEPRFPTLAKLARKFLCVMGTSVPSERVFSVAGLTVTDKRSQISSEFVDKIIFLNKALKEKYKQESVSLESVPLMAEVKVKIEPGTA